MNRKLLYSFSLIGCFLMWGVFGFAAAPGNEPNLQATLLPPETTAIATAATSSAGIPVTGDPEPVWTEILTFYGLIGLTALLLVLALLNLVNKSSAPYAQERGTSTDETHRH
jgi:hypothetical protein